jgi:hypothetical protein
MSKTILSIIAVAALAVPALASSSTDAMKSCAASWDAMSAAAKSATTYKEYSTTCLKNQGTSRAMSEVPTTQQEKMKACAAQWDTMKKTGMTMGQSYEQFSAGCLKGN